MGIHPAVVCTWSSSCPVVMRCGSARSWSYREVEGVGASWSWLLVLFIQPRVLSCHRGCSSKLLLVLEFGFAFGCGLCSSMVFFSPFSSKSVVSPVPLVSLITHKVCSSWLRHNVFYKAHNKTLDHMSLTIWGYVNNCNTKYQGKLYSGITRLCFIAGFVFAGVFPFVFKLKCFYFSYNMGGTFLAVDLLNVCPCLPATAETCHVKAPVN